MFLSIKKYIVLQEKVYYNCNDKKGKVFLCRGYFGDSGICVRRGEYVCLKIGVAAMIRLCAFADEAAKTLTEQVRIMKKNGIALLELRSIDGINVLDMTLSQAEKYAEELTAANISVFSIGSPLGKADISVNFEDYKKSVVHIFGIAKIFGAKNVRVFSFFNAYDKADEVVARLQYMADEGARPGLNICHENEKEVFGDTLERVLYLKSRVRGLKLIYDPANFIQCGESAKKTRLALQKDVYYYHIKDVSAETGELVPAGYGDGEIEKLIADIAGDKVLTLEPHLKVFDGYKNIDHTEMKNKMHYATNEEAFTAAAEALKKLLAKCGYLETEGGYIK